MKYIHDSIVFSFVVIIFEFPVNSCELITHISLWRHQMETFSALLALLALCVGNQRSPVISPHKACDAELWCFLVCLLICALNKKNNEADDSRRYRAHYDVIIMPSKLVSWAYNAGRNEVIMNDIGK